MTSADKGDDALDLAVKLLRSAEDMGIVLGKAADPQQAVQHPGPFVAVNRAELEITERQVTVAAQMGLIDHHVGEAVHRLDAVTSARPPR